MSEADLVLTPEAEELLRELAADSESTLLRVRRGREVDELSSLRAEVSARAAGLSSAERALLEGYRDEVALLMRCQFYEAYRELESQRALRSLRQGAARCKDALGGHGVHERLEARAGELEREFRQAPLTQVLSACLETTRGRGASLTQLAAASLRLAPSEAGRGYVGMAHLVAGHRQSALRVFQELAATSATQRGRAHAHSYLGETREWQGHLDLALEQYREAWRLGEFSESLLSAFVAAAQLGDVASLRELGAVLRARFGTSSEEVRCWVRFVQGKRLLARTAAHDESGRVPLETLAHELGDAPREVLHALQ